MSGKRLCPTCHRRFDEPGFCPFDGTPLAPDPETDQGPPTEHDLRRETLPLMPVPGVKTAEVTAAGARSAPASPAATLERVHTPRETGYDQLVGQTLDGRYYLASKIGEGSVGVVFHARHAVIERPLAIKVLKREAMRDTQTIRRFVQEAKAASRIGHPNIVDVTDFGSTPDGMTYSVMEFVAGQTLGAAIRLGAPFAPPRALAITTQIARALAAAHDKGIVHRDLKPANIFLVERDGRPDFVKIVDFGIAKVTPLPGGATEPRLTRVGSVFGTPEYMAPEQAAGHGDIDGRADIYALGVILYQMICGRVPHRGDSLASTLAMQMLDPIEPPSKVRPDLAIAPALEAVVMRALAKPREQRYPTMGELVDALATLGPLGTLARLGASDTFDALAARRPPAPGASDTFDALAARRLPAPGANIAGAPVYTLAALPPGADPGLVPAMPAVPLQFTDPARAASQTATEPGTPRAPTPPARSTARSTATPPATPPLTNKPEVTTGEATAHGLDSVSVTEQPPAYQDTLTDERRPAQSERAERAERAEHAEHAEHAERTERTERTRRRPRRLALALIAAGAAGVVGLVVVILSRPNRGAGQTRDEAVAARSVDAGARQAPIGAAPDAATLAALATTGDATTPTSDDAALATAPTPGDAALTAATGPDAGRSVRPLARPGAAGAAGAADVAGAAGTAGAAGAAVDAGAAGVAVVSDPEASNQRMVRVQVVTRPEGANLYDGGHYRGPSGTELEAPMGSKLVLTCRHPGYKPGTVEIDFNGTATIATCAMQRIKICINGIKNPFDDCEIDPAVGPPDSAAGAPTDDPATLIDPGTSPQRR